MWLSRFICFLCCRCCASWLCTMRLLRYVYQGPSASCSAPSRCLCLLSCELFPPLSRARLLSRAAHRNQACQRTNSNAQGLSLLLLRVPLPPLPFQCAAAWRAIQPGTSHGRRKNGDWWGKALSLLAESGGEYQSLHEMYTPRPLPQAAGTPSRLFPLLTFPLTGALYRCCTPHYHIRRRAVEYSCAGSTTWTTISRDSW